MGIVETFVALLAAAILGGLAWAARATAAASGKAEKASPPLGHFIHSNDCKLHYVDRGTGIPLVLIHGASSNLRDFEVSIAGPLSRSYRVIAFDRPGYGYSSRPRGRNHSPAWQARCLRDALAQLKIEQPILLGHSLGAAVALAYAVAYPHEVRSLITLSAAAHPWGAQLSMYRRMCALPVLGPLLASTVVSPVGSRWLDAGIRSSLAPGAPPEGYRLRAGVDLLLRPHQLLADSRDVCGLQDFLRGQCRAYPRLSMPITVIVNAEDAVIHPSNSRALYERVPNSRLVVLDGAGHAPHLTQPEAVIRAIHAHLQDEPRAQE